MMLWVGRNVFCFFTMIIQDARNNLVVFLFFKKEYHVVQEQVLKKE